MAEIIIRYFRNINKENVQLDFLINSKESGDFEEEILNSGSEIYKTVPYHQNIFKNFWDKYKILKEKEYDVIHIHTVGASMLIDGFIAKICSINKIIYHTHIVYPTKTLLHYLSTPIFRFLGTDFWACSKKSAIYFFGRNIIKKENYKIIYNALNLEEYCPKSDLKENLKKEFEINNEFIVGFIGRLSEQKNIKFVIDIFKKILEENSNSLLLIVGDGEEDKKLKEYTMEIGINEKVIFTGIRKDINKMLQIIDVVVMPSFYEGLGMVAVESQAVNTNIIVSENIPDEAKITNSIYTMLLSDGAHKWAKKALKIRNENEKKSVNNINKMRQSNYNIKSEAKKLESYYKS